MRYLRKVLGHTLSLRYELKRDRRGGRLGVEQFALISPINRTSNAQSEPSSSSAPSAGQGMRLTADGARVVTAIRACQRQG